MILEIQLLRLVQRALAEAEIMTERSQQVRHQGSRLMSIAVIRVAELGTHPLFLHAELDPERDKEENENDKPAHLGEGNRGAKEPGQNAGVDGMTDHGIGTAGDQLMALLNGDGAAPVAAEMHARPDGKQQAGNGDGSSQPEWPEAIRPEREVKPGQRDVNWQEENHRDQENEEAQDARGSRLEALGGFGIGGSDLPVDKKDNPDNGKERFVEPEHSEPSRAPKCLRW
ncbi:hypothetical protein SBA5_540091 [Candidatus Sulfotelmatomonas gaucii]|uniref:Uncharacterized protein n=1 Tax=Candidatus Sulfuritelmatomonas gaucii TaxID=2043161 RepID=A0A2N9LTA1_9BACT|nr:hypothetical protein SBA5_540091 [Candidatus Sulfotelmatomonas gaucii]